MTRPRITVEHGTPEWDALFEALDQYTDNQEDYLENHCEPGEEKRGAKHLKFARKILDKMNAFYASLADASFPQKKEGVDADGGCEDPTCGDCYEQGPS
jgi:hypothetical protein